MENACKEVCWEGMGLYWNMCFERNAVLKRIAITADWRGGGCDLSRIKIWSYVAWMK